MLDKQNQIYSFGKNYQNFLDYYSCLLNHEQFNINEHCIFEPEMISRNHLFNSLNKYFKCKNVIQIFPMDSGVYFLLE